MGMGAEWNGHADGYATDIYEGNTEKIVATAFDDDVIARPNAHRIVAAPELLAALEIAVASGKSWKGISEARAAIAKARGQNV